MPTPKKLLYIKPVTIICGIGSRAIRYQVKAGKFPKPKYINGRCVWTEDEIAEHQAKVMQENWGGEHAFTKTPALTEPSET